MSNAVVEVILKKPYMNFPKGAKVTLGRDKADLLVKRKTAIIKGVEASYSEDEVGNKLLSKQKEIDEMNGKLLDATDENVSLKKANAELNGLLDEEQRKVGFLESKVKKYSDAYRDFNKTEPENKAVNAPPVDKMIKGDKSETKDVKK